VCISIVDDAEIARLNQEHLKHEGPTDVLTFDLSDGGNGARKAGTGDSRLSVDGDLVISVETAGRESSARGHAVEAELALYVVHGILHLLGYDDANQLSADKMHAVEDEILGSIGFGPIYSRPTIPSRRKPKSSLTKRS